MTNDTMKAMDIIIPMAKILLIDVKADDDWLYCNGQKIGISGNSAYATIKEFIGYAMLEISHRGDCRYNVPASLEKQIKENWR